MKHIIYNFAFFAVLLFSGLTGYAKSETDYNTPPDATLTSTGWLGETQTRYLWYVFNTADFKLAVMRRESAPNTGHHTIYFSIFKDSINGTCLAEGNSPNMFITSGEFYTASSKYWFELNDSWAIGERMINWPNVTTYSFGVSAPSALAIDNWMQMYTINTLEACVPTGNGTGCFKDSRKKTMHTIKMVAHTMAKISNDVGTVSQRCACAENKVTKNMVMYLNGAPYASLNNVVHYDRDDSYRQFDITPRTVNRYKLDESIHDPSIYTSDMTASERSTAEKNDNNKGVIFTDSGAIRVYFISYRDATAKAGTGIQSVSGSKTNVDYNKQVTFTKTVKPGYTWDGWYNGNTRVSTAESFSFSMPGENVTYTAMATPNTYTITFDANGGDVLPSSQTYKTDEEITLPVPTRKDYVFVGWKTTAVEGSWTNGTKYAPGVKPSGKYGNVTMQAQWVRPVLTISAPGLSGTAVFNVTKSGSSVPAYTIILDSERSSSSILLGEVATWIVRVADCSVKDKVVSATSGQPEASHLVDGSYTFAFTASSGASASRYGESYVINWKH